jgi:glycosyltransferase involved in cell wall biosynthesis
MHLLYFCNEYPPSPHGGIGVFVQLMARTLARRGHKVSVAGLYPIRDFSQENDLGVDVYRLPAMERTKIDTLLNHYRLSKFITRLHGTRSIDLIESSELGFGLLVGKLPAPTIIRIHGGHHFFSATLGQPRRWSTSLIEKRSFQRADHFCAVSQFAAETTRELLGLGSRPIEILPNPVDTQLFRPFSEISERDGLLVFTGGLREKKGIRQLLAAMPLVLEKYPAAHLQIYGPDQKDRVTGQSFLEILRKEVDPGIASHIEFCGVAPHADLPKINALASVLVYPSWMETQGIVVIEGMASGRPVITSQTGPGPELITDGQDGLLCDPHSPESIAEKILLLLKDPVLRKRLSTNARSKAEISFSMDVLMQKNLAFYDACLVRS